MFVVLKERSFKGIVVNPIGIRDQLKTENNRENINTFYEDLKPKMKLALAATFERLKIDEPALEPSNSAARPRNIFHICIPSLPAAVNVDGRDQQSAEWLDLAAEWLDKELLSGVPSVVCKPLVLQFWEQRGTRFPALQRLARAVLPAQASSAASERVWSAADDLCGGDRSNLKPETLNATLMLRMNTAVRAECEGVGVFDALTKGK